MRRIDIFLREVLLHMIRMTALALALYLVGIPGVTPGHMLVLYLGWIAIATLITVFATVARVLE